MRSSASVRRCGQRLEYRVRAQRRGHAMSPCIRCSRPPSRRHAAPATSSIAARAISTSSRSRAKGPKDFVSEIDRAAEAAIVETLLGDLSGPRDPRRGRHRARARTRRPSTSGSSIRSTARPTSCTASRSTACRSRSRTAAWSRRASSTIRCATTSSPRRAGAARSSTTAASASRKRQHLRDCLIGTGFPFRDGSYLDTYLAMMRDDDHADGRHAPPGRRGARPRLRRRRASTTASGKSGLNPWDVAAGQPARPRGGRPDRRPRPARATTCTAAR